MTRFARAKGSKSSNERLPENATSWTEMKEQLLRKNQEIEENKKRHEIHIQRNANYKAFLEDKEEKESKETVWADFPDSGSSVKENKKIRKLTHKNIKSNKKLDDMEFKMLKRKVDQALDNNNALTGISNDNSTLVIETTNLSKRKAQRVNENETEEPTEKTTSTKNNHDKIDSDSDEPPDEQTAKEEVVKPVVKIKKPKQKKIKIIVNNQPKEKVDQQQENHKTGKRKLPVNGDINKKFKTNDEGTSVKINSKTKEGTQKKKIIKENLTETALKKIERKKQKRLKQVLKKKRIKEELKKQKEQSNESIPSENNQTYDTENPTTNSTDMSKKYIQPKGKFKNNIQNLNAKKKKERTKSEEHSRRKPLLPHKMFINGKELEIEYLDGFPIKKEDAQRIKKLRKEMISKGLPRSEINIALKLERRKAEKAFTREKKKVCFHCRKSGHNLSECPELNKDQVAQTAGSGICFKCGSTEHTHFECKVVRGQEFKFAQCFICNEQGHIARQCPDNAKGLYPKGNY